MKTLIEKINVANNGNEIIDLMNNSLANLQLSDWDEKTKFTLDEMKFHLDNWKKGFLLSELKNTNRIGKMIDCLNKLEATVGIKKLITEELTSDTLENVSL
jgi:hypothetical protein